MIRTHSALIALAASLLGATAVASAAHAEAAPDCKAVVQGRIAQEVKERSLLETIVGDAKAHGGLGGLTPHFDELKAMLDRAPKTEIAACDGVRYVRDEGLADAPAAPAGGKETVETLPPSPYPRAAMLLGSAYVELQQWADADHALSKGLALEPNNPRLATEDALALGHLGRHKQALELCDRLLAKGVAEPLDKARLLRTRGYMLGELHRYDEAIAAYQDSLTAQPGNGVAESEIAYLNKLKAGGAPAESSTIPSRDAQSVAPPH